MHSVYVHKRLGLPVALQASCLPDACNKNYSTFQQQTVKEYKLHTVLNMANCLRYRCYPGGPTKAVI